jgi:SecD/SecF fusion protein
MNAKFAIIKKSPIWLFIWAILVALSSFLFFSNARYSEEFTGGISLSIEWELQVEKEKTNIENYLLQQNYQDIKVSLEVEDNITNIKIHTKVDSDEKVAELSQEIQSYLVVNQTISSKDQIIQQTITWPSVWSYMQKAALRAMIVGLIFIIIYMLFSFSAIRNYISPAILWVVTVVTMFFDIAIPAWAYWLWMSINSTIQVDTIFIIAILTTMWYSINDTIIIFDRIRENLQNKWTGKDVIYGNVFETSLWQTIKRSIFTSFSTLLVVVAMFVFGSGVIQNFAFVIWIWIIAWSFSSIFIATPLAYIVLGKYKKEKNKL